MPVLKWIYFQQDKRGRPCELRALVDILERENRVQATETEIKPTFPYITMPEILHALQNYYASTRREGCFARRCVHAKALQHRNFEYQPPNSLC